MINLEECGIVREDILNGVVENLADRLYEEIHYDALKNAQNQVATRVETMVNDAILKKVEDLLDAPIQKYDLWSEKIGKPTTVKELIEESFKTWWTCKVDNKGQPSGSYGATMTRAQYLVNKVAADAISGSLKADFDKMLKGAKDQLGKALSSEITRIVNRAFK